MPKDSYSDVVTRFATADSMDQLPAIIDVRATTPANPPAAIQQKFVGSSYAPAFAEAETFVRAVNEYAEKHTGQSLSSARRVIDFGSGWGRITRMLLLHMPPTKVYALDVDDEMTALVNTTLPGVNAVTVAPMPPTALGDASFDVAVAFSVFSHLSGPAHDAWAAEFGRVIAPGGVVAITVLEDIFFGQVEGAAAAVKAGSADDFAHSLGALFPDVQAARDGFAHGEIQYAPAGGGESRTSDFYGWAAAPPDYVRGVWGAAGFRLVEWVPSGELFGQALVILVRESDPVQVSVIANLADHARRHARRLTGRFVRRARHGASPAQPCGG